MDFMNDLCGLPFWDSNLTWNTRDIPSFTDCFEHTALIWIPSFYSCVFFPLECYFLNKSNARDIPFNKYNIVKLTFIILMIMQNISEVFNLRDQNITTPPIYIYSSILKCLSSILFFALTVANIKRGIRSSAVLFWYSFILLICTILPQIRPSVLSLKGEEVFKAEFGNGLLSCFLSFVVFTLNCFADSKPKYKLTQQKENYCPSHDASHLSKILFCWFDVIVWKTHQNPSTTVLWAMEPEESASYLSQKFEKYYSSCNTQAGKQEQTIIKPILKMFWHDITMATFYRFVTTLSSLSFSLIFGLLLTYVENDEPAWKGYFCSFLFLVNGFLLAIASNGTLILSIQLQYKIRSVLVSTIYRKALRISSSSRKKYTTGDIINLLSMDAENVTKSMIPWIMMLMVPIQIALIFYFIWDLLGYSALAIIVVLLVGLPFTYFLCKKIKDVQIIRMKKRDSRGKFIQDVLTGIKILKLYAWETYFEKEISQRRQTELQTTAKYTDLKAFNLFIFACVPLLMSTLTFVTYIFSNPNHNEMSIKTAFVTVSLLGSLSFVLRLTQSGLTSWMEAIVSVDRINEFLRTEELDSNAISHDQIVEEAIIMENCSFSWIGEASSSPTLIDINIKIKEGSIVSIVGSVGCGKSSLISAILGDMYRMRGSINVKGKIAYVSQQAWILNTSLKENITLGHPVTESIYEKALDVCALRTDLETMPDGDMTEIGEKGINLSGGQKQRISLARAICYEADIYLFDDPFSAVDFHIANHIFQQAIGPNSILKDKTRLLVTHSTPFLSQTDSIIVLKQGHISEVGNYQTLLENDGEFAKFLQSYSNKIENKDDKIINNTESFEDDTSVKILRNTEADSNPISESPKTLIEEEKLRTVTVKWSVYKYFFSAIGIFFSTTSLAAFVFYQIFSILSNIWLAKWSNASSNNTNSEHFYFEIYLILGFAEAMIILAGYVLFLRGVLKGSSCLHNTLISDVLKWPMWLLHSTPVGRIISRLIEDIFILDDVLGIMFVDLLLFIGKFLSICAVVTYITPVSVIIVIPIFLSFYIIMKFYLPLGHQIARLKSMSKSALYSSLVESISGVSSVRSYGYENRSITKSHEKIDHFSSTVKSDIMCIRCMNIKMDILAGLFSCFASIFAINARNDLDIGLIALSISYSIQMAKEVVMLLLTLLFVKQFMVAVERIKDYIEQPQEAPSYKSGDSKHTGWPNKAEISFENYSLKYRDDMDLVLHDISFKIKSGERIGIVGRTGAGKTSLILGIFRLVEAATGRIIIDDIDISTIGLHLLRSRLTLIPQDPVLFLGTIRFNLDPTGKSSDENLWKILEKAHLKKFVSDLPGGLQYHIDEGGANISYGQRQLICLARALLRKTKILILDEATASVDVETDELIQETIRNEFNDCTVLTIAHRLNTVIDYDRILVMDRGHVVEFDTPSNLMKSENSNFHRMAHESGLLPNKELK